VDQVYAEFRTDLDRVGRLLDLLEANALLSAIDRPGPVPVEPYQERAAKVYEAAIRCRSDLAVLPGTLVLYLAGRFEYYVRTQFEELCGRVAQRAAHFRVLPKVMRDNLVRMTGEIMANPRKYGHGEKRVAGFVAVLAANLADPQLLTDVNAECLSVTYENMRESVLTELFERIGIKKVWERIGEQAKIKTHFETHESGQAKSLAIAYLNTLMERRNRIAHPSGSVEWPDVSAVRKDVEFLSVCGEVLSNLMPNFEADLAGRFENRALPPVSDPPPAPAPN
jgi:hypothetical protein